MDTENDVLDHLTKEHREVEEIIAKLKDGEPGPERDDLVEELVDSLSTHMAVEERFIYPIAARHLGDEEAEDATDEHDIVREALEAVRARTVGGAFEAALEVLEQGIDHHVTDEEEEMFPKLREQAGGEIAELDPEDLEQKVKADGGSGSDGGSRGSDEPTRDELYEKAREKDVPGRSSMNKEELQEALDGDG